MAAELAPRLSDFVPGTIRGSPGFVRVGRTRAGQWWLLDHADQAIFSCGVAAVNRSGRPGGRSARPGPYSAAVERRHGRDPAVFAVAVARRMRAWRMNTFGLGSTQELFSQGLYYTETLDFRKVFPEATIRLAGALLPDAFDRRWIAACEQWAGAICLPRRSSRELIGYFTDHDLEWAQPEGLPGGRAVGLSGGGRPTLLQICLSLEPSFAAYHAAWEFVLAPHAGNLDALAAAWGVAIPNKETLRQKTKADEAIGTPGYARDHARFSAEFSRRYFAACGGAIRRIDPGHLVLGCRFVRPAPVVIEAAAGSSVDLLSVALAGADPAAGLARLGAWTGPVLVTEFSWTGEEFLRRGTAAAGQTSVERMLSRGRGALEALIRQPQVVGYAWRRWADGPEDQPPFGAGVVHIDDRKAREHTELLADINRRAVPLHAGAAAAPPGT